MRIFLILNATAIGAYGMIPLIEGDRTLLMLFCGWEHFVGGMITAIIFTEMMYHCRQQYEAMDYTLQASLFIKL